MTAISTLAKPDTVLLLDTSAGDIFVDGSQYRTNLTDNTTYIDEPYSARVAFRSPREIAIVVDASSDNSGVLAELGNAGGYSWRVKISATSAVEVAEESILRASVELPSLSKSASTYLIHWSTHPTTAGYIRHELAVYNYDADEWAHAQATHSESFASSGHTLTVGAALGGSSAYDGGLAAISKVRIGRRFHSLTEAAEDWIGLTTPPAMTQVRRGAPLVPDRATLDLVQDGSFAGPALLWSGHAFEQSDRRLVSPLVNLRVHDPIRISNDSQTDAATQAWWRLAPGSATTYLALPYLFYRAVPGKVNRARARIFVRHTIEVGDDTAEVRYRLYSLANLPVVGEPIGALSYRRTAAATCSTAHGATRPGEWLALGDLALEVDGWGCTWLALGIEFDQDSPLVGDTRVHVHAVTVEPFALASGGGLDIALP